MPNFGTVVSESGSSYTWAENCHEYRLTPWNNDPVVDPSGEAFYIRDEETGQYWSPTPGPARGSTPYVIRHGFGYSVFEHAEFGLSSELSLFVATDAPIKFAVCKVRNLSTRHRRISVTGYWDWVLGELRPEDAAARAERSSIRTQGIPSRPQSATRRISRTEGRIRLAGCR